MNNTSELSKYSESNVGFDNVDSSKMFRVYFDETTRKFRIITSSRDVFELLKKNFTTANKNAFFINNYGYNVSDEVSIINDFGFFPVGMVFEILEYIKLTYGTLSCVYMSQKCKDYVWDYLLPLRSVKEKLLHDPNFKVLNISDDSGKNAKLLSEGKNPYKLRDYQENAIKALMFDGCGRGIVELPTSSGKSFLIANFIYNLQKFYKSSLKVLIFVPNRLLVDQMYGDLLEYGFNEDEITKLAGGIKKSERQYDPNASVIISNRDYTFKNKDKLPKIDVLFTDEVHQVAPKSWTLDFIENLDCKIKVGCSGTVPREKFHRWTLTGAFGKTVYSEAITDLQNRGFITKINLKYISIIDENVENNRNYLFNLNSNRKYNPNHPEDVMFDEAYKQELEYIKSNYEDLYVPVFEEIKKLNRNVLVLFDKIEFGSSVYNLAKDQNLRGSNIMYIDGSTEMKERELVKQELEKSDNNILFANVQIMGTGVSINNIDNLVFMFSSKSAPRVIQSIGRVLRKHKDKEIANVLDINFNFKYSQKHFSERKSMYRQVYHKTNPDEIKTIRI